MPDASVPSGSLYAKIINKEGVVGLIAFMGVAFMMTVIYRGQQHANEIHMEILEEQRKTNAAQTQANNILEDIRYSIKASNGITFRNDARP
jgi:hypothetical protein